MLSRVMANNVLTANAAEELRLRAEIARTSLVASGESSPVDMYDADGHVEVEDELVLYDALVPIFFR
jgi:hypothetical protein